jgi:hypothetical protein
MLRPLGSLFVRLISANPVNLSYLRRLDEGIEGIILGGLSRRTSRVETDEYSHVDSAQSPSTGWFRALIDWIVSARYLIIVTFVIDSDA